MDKTVGNLASYRFQNIRKQEVLPYFGGKAAKSKIVNVKYDGKNRYSQHSRHDATLARPSSLAPWMIIARWVQDKAACRRSLCIYFTHALVLSATEHDKKEMYAVPLFECPNSRQLGQRNILTCSRRADSPPYFSCTCLFHFRPRANTIRLRTTAFHSVVVGYLAWLKKNCFRSVHIWAAPSKEGQDYVLFCKGKRPVRARAATPQETTLTTHSSDHWLVKW